MKTVLGMSRLSENFIYCVTERANFQNTCNKENVSHTNFAHNMDRLKYGSGIQSFKNNYATQSFTNETYFGLLSHYLTGEDPEYNVFIYKTNFRTEISVAYYDG